MNSKFLRKTVFLGIFISIILVIYLTYNTYGNLEFALKFRGKKIIAFALVSLATAFSTISFQTLTENRFLTPSILGLDSVYVFFKHFYISFLVRLLYFRKRDCFFY